MSESSGVGSSCEWAVLVLVLLVLVSVTGPALTDVAPVAEEVVWSARVLEGVEMVVEEGGASVTLGELLIECRLVREGSETRVPVPGPVVELLRDDVAVWGREGEWSESSREEVSHENCWPL